MKKFDSIQLLRGLGAGLIYLFHLNYIRRGEFAVDIFFCISGFIMMYSTNRNSQNILLKRFIRIIPLYYFFTFLMFIIIKFLPNFSLMSTASYTSLIKSLLFIPYISSGVDKVNYVVPLISVGWTLNLEMYFYIIFYVCCKINFKKRGLYTSIILIFISIIGLIINSNNLLFKFLTNSVILEFVFGILTYYIYFNYIIVIKNKFIIPFLIIIFLVLLWYINGISLFYNIRVLRYGILSFFCFILTLYYFTGININHMFCILGNISFSFYFIEFFTTAIINKIIINYCSTFFMYILTTIIGFLVTIIISYISWYLIENKLYLILNNKIIKE